ncbi:MAG TPA: hypothetical protein VFC76_01020 [Oscillospiraceae bacterium]|nr:hypothetical protein [Oscillospiraceae bacterium]
METAKIEFFTNRFVGDHYVVDDRYYIYCSDWCIYDDLKADEIPMRIFRIRDFLENIVKMSTLDRKTYARIHARMQRGHAKRHVINGKLYCEKSEIDRSLTYLCGRKAKNP